MAWEMVFESAAVRVETECRHPFLYVRLQLRGDPQHYVDGVRTEHVTRVPCARASDLLWIIDHVVIDRSSGEYVPRGRWEDTAPFDELVTTEILEYEEQPEEDPEGDYQITVTHHVVEAANPQNVVIHNVYRFKMTRRALVDVLAGIAAKMRACCAGEIGMRPPRERERRV